MSRKAAAGEYDRINLRIKRKLKDAIEGNFGTGIVPQKSFADFLSSLAEAHLLQHGVHVDDAVKPAKAAKAKAAAPAKRKAPKPPQAKAVARKLPKRAQSFARVNKAAAAKRKGK